MSSRPVTLALDPSAIDGVLSELDALSAALPENLSCGLLDVIERCWTEDILEFSSTAASSADSLIFEARVGRALEFLVTATRALCLDKLGHSESPAGDTPAAGEAGAGVLSVRPALPSVPESSAVRASSCASCGAALPEERAEGASGTVAPGRPRSSGSQGRGRDAVSASVGAPGDDIEITADMIRLGSRELWGYHGDGLDNDEAVLRRIFLAMYGAMSEKH